MIAVYKFGCRKPDNEQLAIQLLGQASNYREDQRVLLNKKLEKYPKGDECAHVRAWTHQEFLAAQRSARMPKRRGHLLDWGTYELVEAAAKQAASDRWPDPVRRTPWDGTGRIGAFISSTEQFPAAEWDHKRVLLTTPDDRGHAKLTILVGEMKAPKAVTWPIKLHRPFPDGAVVKKVAVQRIRVGWRFRWQALVTVEFERARRDLEATGTVGVDLGWRWTKGDLLKVATCSDATVLVNDVMPDLFYADEVRSTRDRLFDDVKNYAKAKHLPGHEHVHLWRDKARMRRLANKTNDFGLLWWEYRDRHLEDIEANVRDRAINRRKDAYRAFADVLAKKYERVALEDLNASDFERRDTHAKERRKASAATYELQQALKHRFGAERIDWISPAYTSRTCSSCHTDMGKLGEAESVACSSCGVTHNRDLNAARNLERLSREGKVLTARRAKQKEKAGKQKNGKKQADVVELTAREPLDNAAE